MYYPRLSARGLKQRRYRHDDGIALISALMSVAVLALLGSSIATITALSNDMSSNNKASMQALQAAEAGAEEARARLRGNAVSPITDALPTQTQWKTYIGSQPQAQTYGYSSSLYQTRTNSLQSNLQYTVVIAHATNSSGQILYWGDPSGTGNNARNTTTGQNIYLVTSHGTAAQARSTVQTQVTRVPPVPLPGTVYVKIQTTIQGSSTNIIGVDQCGTTHRPGIATNLASTVNGQATIVQHGNPNITGNPAIAYNSTNINVQNIVNSYKPTADLSYTVQSATHTASTTPGPGDNWGTPTAGATLQNASSCSTYKTVYYNTNNTYVRLSGGVQGCGLLLVEGDLELHGGFSWYGPVVVTGSVTYTGGGNKNTTGALISGGDVTADVIGGNANIVNCSTALVNQGSNSPLLVLNWNTL